MPEEIIYDVYWEGPFDWASRVESIRDCHVLYQIYGAHHVYGRDVLLYIGSSSNVVNRLNEHEEWVSEEYDRVRVRFGSVGEFTNWEEWDEDGDYKKAEADLVKKIEALLIYAHQPANNTQNKSNVAIADGIRIFNSGRLGQLLPEISYLYHWGQ